MATKYLQLRVHDLTCVKMTENRQNIFGIPLETDPDSIDISAIITDPVHGVVAQAPTVFLGNRYTNGKRESFSPPKVIAEVPVADTDPFPRRVQVTVNMAEKDDGAGFDALLESVAGELADVLREEVGGALDSGITESTYYRVVEQEVGNVIQVIFSAITQALGLGDDPFRPIVLTHELRSLTDAPSGTRTVNIYEPNPQHKGQFKLTYSWHLVDQPAFTTGSTSGIAGAAAALKSDEVRSAVPYPRPYRKFQFASPMKKKAAVSVVVKRPATTKTSKPAPVQRPIWLYPMSLRPLGAGSQTE